MDKFLIVQGDNNIIANLKIDSDGDLCLMINGEDVCYISVDGLVSFYISAVDNQVETGPFEIMLDKKALNWG